MQSGRQRATWHCCDVPQCLTTEQGLCVDGLRCAMALSAEGEVYDFSACSRHCTRARRGQGVTVQALTATFRWGNGGGYMYYPGTYYQGLEEGKLSLTVAATIPAWLRQKVIVVCKVYVFTCKHGFVPAK